MNGLLMFIGGSFRQENQNVEENVEEATYQGQIAACNSHIGFIEYIKEKFQMNSVSVYIGTYTTKYDEELLKIYEKYIVKHKIHPYKIGYSNIFNESMKDIEDKETYDFIFHIRIDLFLRTPFYEIVNVNWPTIHFISICWCKSNNVDGHPRINDMMLFIPKKYYGYIQNIYMGHDVWKDLIINTDLTYDDMDTMVNTYHDSDSAKDYNPYYYIVNRHVETHWYSDNEWFDKKVGYSYKG